MMLNRHPQSGLSVQGAMILKTVAMSKDVSDKLGSKTATSLGSGSSFRMEVRRMNRGLELR